MFSGLLSVRAAELGSDPEVKVVEVNKLLKSVISMPHKVPTTQSTTKKVVIFVLNYLIGHCEKGGH